MHASKMSELERKYEGNIQQEGYRETEPLLRQSSVTSDVVHVATGPGTIKKKCRNWKNISAAVCLWLTYMICSMAYSVIAPFFPDEVC